MKNANEFKVFGADYSWVQSNLGKNDPFPSWWFCLNNTALFCAIETERNNRGVKLRTHRLTGDWKEIMLKPENGNFKEIDLDAFWDRTKML